MFSMGTLDKLAGIVQQMVVSDFSLIIAKQTHFYAQWGNNFDEKIVISISTHNWPRPQLGKQGAKILK